MKVNPEHQIEQWKVRLDEVSRQVEALCGHLDLDALNRKPSLERWSVAQVLDHLITINQSYFPMLDRIVLGEFRVPLHGRIPIVRRFFGRFVLQGVQPDRKRKMKTFPIWEPTQSDLPADMVNRFTRHQSRLTSKMDDALPLLEQGVVIHSPASRMIVYSLADAFEIIVTHEERHLEQVREVMRGGVEGCRSRGEKREDAMARSDAGRSDPDALDRSPFPFDQPDR